MDLSNMDWCNIMGVAHDMRTDVSTKESVTSGSICAGAQGKSDICWQEKEKKEKRWNNLR